MSRERPSGERLEWELLLPESRRLPFWIADRTPRDLRVPGDPAATTHANGAAGLAGFAVRAVGAPLAAIAIGDLFGAVPEAGPDGRAWIASTTFAIEVEEGREEGVCAAMLRGCSELPEQLRSLGLRSG